MERKHLVMAGSLFLVIALGLTGIAGGAEKDTLKVALGVEPTSLDPQRTADLMTAGVQRQIYNYLFVYDKNMKLVPELAESYKLSADKKTWTFSLRKGIKFHNGEEFNAAAVKFTIDRILDPATKSPRSALFKMIQSVKIIDNHTIAFTTHEPFLPMLPQLTYYPLAILSPMAVKQYQQDYDRHPVGTGPFRFVEWKAGDRIVLERNESYWEPKPRLKRLEIRFVKEDAARTMLLETGEADFIVLIPPREAQRLQGNKNLDIVMADSHFTAYINFINVQEKPFDSPLVRKALNHAIDKKALVDSILLGSARVYDSPLSPIGWGYHKTGAYEYNPELAKKLLTEAGYKDQKLKIELWTSVGRYTMDTELAEAIQGQLRQVGVEAELQKKADWGSFLFGLRKGKNRIGMAQAGPITADADQALYPLYHSKGDLNWMKYSNPEVDNLLEKSRQLEDPKARRDTLARIQEIVFKDAPLIWLYYPKTIYGQKKEVKGIIYMPLEHVLFKNAYKE